MPLIAIGLTFGSVLCFFISYMMIIAGFSPVNQALVLISFNGIFGIIQFIGLLAFVPNSPSEKIIKQ